MALIKCPECKRDISDAAEACPNCGHPMGASTNQVGDADVLPMPEQRKCSCGACSKEMETVSIDWKEIGNLTSQMIGAMDQLDIDRLGLTCPSCGTFSCVECLEKGRIRFRFRKLWDFKDPFFCLRYFRDRFRNALARCPSCNATLKLPAVYVIEELGRPILINDPSGEDTDDHPRQHFSVDQAKRFYARANGLKRAEAGGKIMCPACGSTSVVPCRAGCLSAEAILGVLLLGPLGLCGSCCGIGMGAAQKKCRCEKCENEWYAAGGE